MLCMLAIAVFIINTINCKIYMITTRDSGDNITQDSSETKQHELPSEIQAFDTGQRLWLCNNDKLQCYRAADPCCEFIFMLLGHNTVYIMHNTTGQHSS